MLPMWGQFYKQTLPVKRILEDRLIQSVGARRRKIVSMFVTSWAARLNRMFGAKDMLFFEPKGDHFVVHGAVLGVHSVGYAVQG